MQQWKRDEKNMLAGQRGDRMRPLMNSSNLTSHNEKVDIPEGAVVAAVPLPLSLLTWKKSKAQNVYGLKKCSV